MNKPFGLLHIGFMLTLGAAGWVTLALMTLWPFPGSMPRFAPIAFGWEAAACFTLGALARLLAFRTFGRVRVALDSVFYVSTRYVLGTLSAAWMIIVSLTLDAIIQQVRGTGPVAPRQAPARHTVAQVLQDGGLPTLVIITLGAIFGDMPLSGYGDWTLAWNLPLFFACFLVIHYFLAGGSRWFLGAASSTLWRRFFTPLVLAELTLTPLCLAMALAYKHQGMFLFVLLGTTGLFFNAIFRRWSLTSTTLHKRVVELSILNRIGRIVSSSFDRRELFRKLAPATIELVGSSSRFTVGFLNEEGDEGDTEGSSEVVNLFFDETGHCYRKMITRPDEGLTGWVLQNRRGLIIDDTLKQYGDYSKHRTYDNPSFRSWLAVPLQVADDVFGVMAVQSRAPHAYTQEHLQLLTTIADQAAIVIANSKLYQLATVDGLTGLFVRRYFDQRLMEEFQRSMRYSNHFALGMFDLDHFKQFNDLYGHQVGDQVLRVAAKVLRDNMRSFDIAARYGGEEFAFLLPRTEFRDAQTVTQRIQADIQALRIDTEQGPVRVTVSIGLAGCPAHTTQGPSALIELADQALYQAKAQGRNRVVTADASRPFHE
ncbi:MAG: sensor domain-containing diguanylate cyclase [Myxococcota bacterium]